MPIITSRYRSSFPLHNGHLDTILPVFLQRTKKPSFRRERIVTPDDDFLDLDWLEARSNTLFILLHGLEGASNTRYIQDTAHYLHTQKLDVLAWNYRGCSEEMNRQLRFYHSGETGDLDSVIRHALSLNRYEKIVLAGFSLGGNIVLKYLGEQGDMLDPKIKAAVAISAPIDLQAAAIQLERPSNKIYLKRFLKSLKWKIAHKAKSFRQIDTQGLDTLQSFHDFDNRYTAPIHGFKDAETYYRLCSSKPLLANIRIPALILTPSNDPFLPRECYPIEEARHSQLLYLESPKSGGHLGFMRLGSKIAYWPAVRMLEFARQQGV